MCVCVCVWPTAYLSLSWCCWFSALSSSVVSSVAVSVECSQYGMSSAVCCFVFALELISVKYAEIGGRQIHTLL